MLVRKGGNLGFDIMVKRLPPVGRHICQFITEIAILVFSVYWFYQGILLCQSFVGFTLSGLQLPYNVLYVAEPVGAFLIALFDLELVSNQVRPDKAIVTPTISGFTAKLLSKWRPEAPIIGLSPSASAVRRMQLYWGVKPYQAKRADSTDILVYASIELLKDKKELQEGDLVVVTAGVVSYSKRHEPASDTNIMRVVTVD